MTIFSQVRRRRIQFVHPRGPTCNLRFGCDLTCTVASKFMPLLCRRPSTASLTRSLVSSSPPKAPNPLNGSNIPTGASFLQVKSGSVLISHHLKGPACSSSTQLILGCGPFWNVGARFLCSSQVTGKSVMGDQKAVEVPGKAKIKDIGSNWSILKRWIVPWGCPTVVVTMSLCASMSYVVPAVISGKSVTKLLSLMLVNYVDLRAGFLFLYSFIIDGAKLSVVLGITSIFKPFADKIFFYKFKAPLSLKEGWLFWTMTGILIHLIASVLLVTGVIYSSLEHSGSKWVSSRDALSPYIGASMISTTFVLGIASIIAPMVEEVLYRGFLMVSLTKWLPTPLSILWSAAAFAVSHHQDPQGFPQYFLIGTILGFSYAQTRNLLVPIFIHSAMNSISISLIFLSRQGDDPEQDDDPE